MSYSTEQLIAVGTKAMREIDEMLDYHRDAVNESKIQHSEGLIADGHLEEREEDLKFWEDKKEHLLN